MKPYVKFNNFKTFLLMLPFLSHSQLMLRTGYNVEVILRIPTDNIMHLLLWDHHYSKFVLKTGIFFF